MQNQSDQNEIISGIKKPPGPWYIQLLIVIGLCIVLAAAIIGIIVINKSDIGLTPVAIECPDPKNDVKKFNRIYYWISTIFMTFRL